MKPVWTTEIKPSNFVVMSGSFIIYYDKHYVYVMNDVFYCFNNTFNRVNDFNE